MKLNNRYIRLLGDTLALVGGTIWIMLFILTGLIFSRLIIPEVDKLLAGRSGWEAWILAFVPAFAVLTVLAIGVYLMTKLVSRYSPQYFVPIKGKIEIQKKGGKKTWYQRLLS